MEPETVEHPSISIYKLAKLITNPMSQLETIRQLGLLKNYINLTKYAFVQWLQDLPSIIKVFDAVSVKISSIPEFVLPLMSLIRLTATPPLQLKLSDKLTYRRDLQEYISMLGYILVCLPENELKQLLLDSIIELFNPFHPAHYQCVPLAIIREVTIIGDLPRITAELAQIINNEFYPTLLKLMILLANFSKENCQKMVENDAINTIILRLDFHWSCRPVHCLFTPKLDEMKHCLDSCELLWKLLDLVETSKISDKIKPPSYGIVWSLEYAIRWSLLRSTRRQSRNELVAIALKLIDLFPSLESVETGLFDQLLAFLTPDFLKTRPLERIDVNLVQLILCSLKFLQTPEQFELIKPFRVVDFLMHIINKRPVDANHAYECDFVVLSLELLPKFVLMAYGDFLWANGPINFILRIKHFNNYCFDIRMLKAFLDCFSEIIFLRHAKIMSSIRSLGAEVHVTKLVEKILSLDQLTLLHQTCLARCFCILEVVYHFDLKPCSSMIVNLIREYFRRVISPKEGDSFLDTNSIISGIDFLWSVIKHDENIGQQFVKLGGIYQLLDIIYLTTLPVKIVALGALADLCLRPTCLPFLITWRKNNVAVVPMLLEVFRGRTETECETDTKGEIKARKGNFLVNLCERQTLTLNVTYAQLMLHCRMKIHSIVRAIRSEFRAETEYINEVYHMYDENFTADERIILVFVDNYFSLRLCKNWLNLAKELVNEGVDPAPDDLNLLWDNLQMIRNWQKCVQKMIEQIIAREEYQDVFDEQKLYYALKEGQLADALDALKELRYICLCTENMFRLQRKFCFSQKVDAMSTQHGGHRYHRTHANLAFTEQCNQVSELQSDVIVRVQKDPEIPPIVSPIPSHTSFGGPFYIVPQPMINISAQLDC